MNRSRSQSLSDLTKLKKQYLYNFFLKKDLKKVVDNGFVSYVIPEQYYIWKGIKLNDPKNKWFVDGIRDNKEIFQNISSNFFADKHVASHYGTKHQGVDLQFKIVKPIKLIDLSDFQNIQTIWKFFKNINIEQLDQYPYIQDLFEKSKEEWRNRERLQKKYPSEKEYFKFCIEKNFKEMIVETIGNFEYDQASKSIKSPTKVHRRSAEWFDTDLVKAICNIFKENCDGWIYFKQDNDDFHDEILVCNAEHYLQYIDFHKK